MNGNRHLFWALVETEHLKARAYCRKLFRNRDDGDDLYQDVLVVALERFHSLRNHGAFRPWLYRIIINSFKNRVRRSWWRTFVPLTDTVADTVAASNPAPGQAARRRLEIAFGALTPYDRALVTLFELEGWSLAEMATLTGKSVGSIKTRLSRSRNKMRAALIKYLGRSATSNQCAELLSEELVCVVMKSAKD
ncbi:MAG: RNA polymerase sigma factor [candidate division Zixibacteria bacterium]|nr:RNA polymerase sigma factor [candidate division Zixibacteria bacterium]